METLKNQTLEQVRDALRDIEDARDDISLSGQQQFYLEKVAVQLRDTERTIIRKTENELVAALVNDSRELKEMTSELKASAEKLTKVASSVEKASKLVELLVKGVVGGISAGLI